VTSEGGRSAGRKVCTGQAGSKKERRLEEAEEDQRQDLLKEGNFIKANVRTERVGGGREDDRDSAVSEAEVGRYLVIRETDSRMPD
jgi:hypothetical protein